MKKEASRQIMHLAITTGSTKDWALTKKKELKDAYSEKLLKLLLLIDFQIKSNIPVVSVHLFSDKIKEYEEYPAIMQLLAEFFELLKRSRKLHENQVKVTIFGKWYDLPGNVVESIKHILEETKDYDNYFLNLCINYDGREELVDAVKLIGRKIKFDKIDVESIDKGTIKENLYSSYFLPPDLILVNGKDQKVNDFLLWDSVGADVIYTKKFWPDLSIKDLEEFTLNKKRQ